MNPEKLIELALYTLPAIITGGVAYYFFNSFLKSEENRRRFLLLKANQKQALPIKLQAYERMALFMERTNPTKLLIRIAPISNDKNDYESLLIAQIEQEFEHNLTQQIYISNECWTMILTAKNATIQMIRNTNKTESITNADQLREAILSGMMNSESPSTIALNFLKNEIAEFL